HCISVAASNGGVPSHVAVKPPALPFAGYRPSGPAEIQPCINASGVPTRSKSPSPNVVTANEPDARSLKSQWTCDVTGRMPSGSARNPEPAPLTPPDDARIPNGGPPPGGGWTNERYVMVTVPRTGRFARQCR